MNSLTTVTRDSSTILTLEEAKTWLRVVGNDEDTLISAILKGAVAYAENYLNKTIGYNSYVMSLDYFSPTIFLMRPPVTTISKIEYIDTNGDTVELDLNITTFDSDSGRLMLKAGEIYPETANQGFPIRIHYTCDGMHSEKDADDVLDAIKLTLTYRYDYRDDPNQRWQKATDNILAPLRIIPFD